MLAAATDPKALLDKVAETYRNLKRYEFDFTLLTDIRSAAGRKSVETRIELTNVRPDKLRILISGGLGEVQVYSDGAVSCVFVPALKQYTRKATSDAKATAPDGASRFAAIAMQVLEQFERISGSVHTAKILRTEKLKVGDAEVECLVIEVELEEQDPDEKRLRTYWIDPQRNLVLKAVQFDKLSGEGSKCPGDGDYDDVPEGREQSVHSGQHLCLQAACGREGSGSIPQTSPGCHRDRFRSSRLPVERS